MFPAGFTRALSPGCDNPGMTDTASPAIFDPSTTAPPPRRRGIRPWAVAALVVAIVAVLLVVRPMRVRTEVAPTYLTEPVRTADLEDVLAVDGLVALDEGATRSVAAPQPGTITEQGLALGDTPDAFEVVIRIDGQPILFVPTETPLYRDLDTGAEGEDVEALERALETAGHDPGEVDEVYDEATADAVREAQEDADVEVTGALLVSELISFPGGMEPSTSPLVVGTVVQAGQPITTVADPRAVHVVARVEGDDIGAISVGDAATVTLEGDDVSLDGVVEEIPMSAEPDGSFHVVIDAAVPFPTRVGRPADVEVVIASRDDALVVPLAAVGGGDGRAEVEVLVDGEPQTRNVELGLVTTEGIEVIGGLVAGDQIILGIDSDAAGEQ